MKNIILYPVQPRAFNIIAVEPLETTGHIIICAFRFSERFVPGVDESQMVEPVALCLKDMVELYFDLRQYAEPQSSLQLDSIDRDDLSRAYILDYLCVEEITTPDHYYYSNTDANYLAPVGNIYISSQILPCATQAAIKDGSIETTAAPNHLDDEQFVTLDYELQLSDVASLLGLIKDVVAASHPGIKNAVASMLQIDVFARFSHWHEELR